MDRCKNCGEILTEFEQEENNGLCHICYAEETADLQETLKHPDKHPDRV